MTGSGSEATTVPPMRRLAGATALCVALAACGGGSGLTAGERAWCTFTDDSSATAERFDLIFEVGLRLQLNMDQVNATAASLREQYESEGMTPDEAIARVSDELFEMEAFVDACSAAYAEYGTDG